MTVQFVEIKASGSGKAMEANIVSKTKELLRLYILESQISMPWDAKRGLYVGNKAGMEFTSDGKVVR